MWSLVVVNEEKPGIKKCDRFACICAQSVVTLHVSVHTVWSLCTYLCTKCDHFACTQRRRVTAHEKKKNKEAQGSMHKTNINRTAYINKSNGNIIFYI